MKALAIGDFHGKCTFSIKQIVKKEKRLPDLVKLAIESIS